MMNAESDAASGAGKMSMRGEGKPKGTRRKRKQVEDLVETTTWSGPRYNKGKIHGPTQA